MGRERDFSHIPIIDVSELVAGGPARRAVAERLGEACRESGFFYVVGHGVDEALQARLRELSRQFFAQDVETKLAIRMALGGRAWRGYFRVGDELTSGKPDQKEGLYFGAELPADDPLVRAGTPLHGPNLFPAEPRGLPRGRAGVHGGADRPGPPADGRAGAEPGPGGVVLRRPLHGRAADPVPHLQLPAAGRPGPLGRRRAHRLRPADDPAAGRRRRPGGEVAVAVGPRPAGAGLVRLQHRRHARPHDRRAVPLHAAPRPQPGPARPALVPVLLRPELLRARAADRPAGPGAPARRPGRALGPGQRPRLRGDLRRLPARQGRQGLPRSCGRRCSERPGPSVQGRVH